MADDANALTPEQKELAAAFLEKYRMGEIPCPICKSNEWVLGGHFVQPVTLGKDRSIQLGGIGYPQIMLVSKQCGYTLFFNAVIVGLFKSRGASEEEGGGGEVGGGPKDG